MATKKKEASNDDDDIRFFATPAAWRAWLEKNHAKAESIRVGFYKKGTGRPSITWPESVDEALSFGWIDGVRRSLGPEAYEIRFTPRKPTSIWSAVNVKRVAELERMGKMTDAGRAAFARRKEAQTAIYSYEQRTTAVLPPEMKKRLDANKKARAWFESQAPYYKRMATYWVISAKKEETREKRLATLVACSAKGELVPPFLQRPGKKSRPPGT
jgi:uncharacterized protein YdeI (YjbR/CyaY-like superfamily)